MHARRTQCPSLFPSPISLAPLSPFPPLSPSLLSILSLLSPPFSLLPLLFSPFVSPPPAPLSRFRWRPLRAGAGRGGSGRAPGWCGWAVTSSLWRCCGGAVCWRPAISLPQSVVVGEVGLAWGCGGGRAAAWASSGRGQLQQACGFTARALQLCRIN